MYLVPNIGQVHATTCTTPNNIVINQLLTEEALKQNVPPEIVKAIALKESDWEQCENGKPHISPDGGIGIMQVTDHEGEYNFDTNRLKTDIQYNIQVGVTILNDKWRLGGSVIPTLNDKNRDVLENWYFAVMAYNGLVHRNSPRFRDGGSRNYNTYQDDVFKIIKESNHSLQLNLALTEVKIEDLQYLDNNRLSFREKHYNLKGNFQLTKHKFKANEFVLTPQSLTLRDAPSTQGKAIKSLSNEVVTIQGGIAYDQRNSIHNHFVWYPVITQDGREGYVASSYLSYFGERISGGSRFLTAVEVSKSGWDRADTVVLTKNNDFPDALAGAPLAAKLDAPILLTHKDRLTPETEQRIKELKAKHVVILGGINAVSTTVEKALEENGLTVERIGGGNRYETAALIAKRLGGNPEKAIVTYGGNYPDALSIAPYAATKGYPILLSRKTLLPDETRNALKGISSTYVIGGENVISESIRREVKGTRISGGNRFATSVAIAEYFKMSTDEVYIATGLNFADALTGSVLAGKNNAPILLVRQITLPPEVKDYVQKQEVKSFKVLGGSSVVSDSLVNNLVKTK